MDRPQAYLNGRFVPADEAVVSATDAGFVLGATISEQLRTFGGRLFRLDDHLARLARGLAVLGGAAAEIATATLASVAQDLAAVNYPLLPSGSDLGLAIVVTPGIYAAFAQSSNADPANRQPSNEVPAPTVLLHTYELPFRRWVDKYRDGEHLVIAPYEQVPRECWPRDVKCRSRMHYYLADRYAASVARGARALLLDRDGDVTETSTANLLIYRAGEGLVSPPLEQILPGISLAATCELAAEAGIACAFQPLKVDEVAAADEVFATSTPNCLLSVTRLNGQAIGDGAPGPIFAKLIAAWSRLVGIDIIAQAQAAAIA